MNTVQRFCASTAMLFLSFSFASAQDEGSSWRVDAERALIGTWEAEEYDVPRIPKLKIERKGSDLQIEFWGRGAVTKDSYGPAEKLYVLSRYPDSKFEDEETALAFATHEADYGLTHFTLRIFEDILHLEGVKIVKDTKNKAHRLITATYTKSSSPPSDAATDKEMEDASEAAKPNAADEKPKAAVKRGTLAGRIESGSTLRGRLTLSPVPEGEKPLPDAEKPLPDAEKIEPADGVEVSSANPPFKFANVPEGDYTIIFRGTANGVTKQLSWPGLSVNVSGADKPISLSVNSGG